MMLCDRPIPIYRGLRQQSRGLPEYATYRDTGCEMASSCLDCPLALCKYDDPTWGQRRDLTVRDDEIIRLHELGIRVQEIAGRIGVSSRTVYRVLQRRSIENHVPRKPDPGVQLMSLDDLAKWTPARIYGEHEEDSGLTTRSWR